MYSLTKIAMHPVVRITLIGLLVAGWVAFRITDHPTIENKLAGQAILGGAIGLMICGFAQCFCAVARLVKNQPTSGDPS